MTRARAGVAAAGVAALVVGTLVLARSGTTTPKRPTGVTDSGAPIAAFVIPQGHAVAPPPGAVPEKFEGKPAYLLDSGSDSLYEWDLVRHRFLGPASQVNTGDRVLPLPGYPFVIGVNTPQDFVRTPTSILIAGGRDGAAVAELDANGNIGQIRKIDLGAGSPVGDQSVDVAVGGPRPLLIEYDPHAGGVGRSKAFSVTAAGEVVKRRQLPGLQTAFDALEWSNTEDLLLGNDATLRWINTDTLAVTRQVKIPYELDSRSPVARLGTALVLSVNSPARLLELDPVTGHSETLLHDPGRYGGPVAVSGGRIYWAPSAGTTLFDVDPVSRSSSTREVCKGAVDLHVAGTSVFVTCLPAKLVVLDGTTVHSYDGGAFPARVRG